MLRSMQMQNTRMNDMAAESFARIDLSGRDSTILYAYIIWTCNEYLAIQAEGVWLL